MRALDKAEILTNAFAVAAGCFSKICGILRQAISGMPTISAEVHMLFHEDRKSVV